MSATQIDTSSASKKDNRNKIKAVLAGGLVLGVGAAITLAAWTDTEFATGSFASGEFGIVGKAAGAAEFTEHPAANSAAALTFTPSSNMTPGTSAYTKFDIQRTAGTTVAAQVTAANPTITGDLASYLKTEAVVLPSTAASCDAAAFTTNPVPYEFGGAGATIDNTASTLPLCLKVTLDHDQTAAPELTVVPQNKQGAIAWEFVATQVV